MPSLVFMMKSVVVAQLVFTDEWYSRNVEKQRPCDAKTETGQMNNVEMSESCTTLSCDAFEGQRGGVSHDSAAA